jgi:hypothetical protein
LWSCHSPNHNDSTKRIVPTMFSVFVQLSILQQIVENFIWCPSRYFPNNPPTEGLRDQWLNDV